MKKTIWVAIFFSCFSCFTYGKNWSFSLSSYTGLSVGKLGEYLYSQYNPDFLVSDLQWQQILWNLGIKSEVQYKNFFANVDFTYYFPFKCGIMEDSDYNSNVKTNYFVYTNNSPLSLEAHLNLGYKFGQPKFCIAPIIKGMFSYRKFQATNGSGYYGAANNVAWNSEQAQWYKAYGIDYTRLSIYSFLGAQVESRFSKFKLDAAFLISPFAYFEDDDFHRAASDLPNDAYHAICIEYSYFSRMIFALGFSFELNDSIALVTQVWGICGGIQKGTHYTNYGHPKGYGFFESDSEYYKSNQPKGMDIYELNFKFGISFIF